MTYTAYLENIRAKTGKGPEYYRKEAKRLGLKNHAERLKWLKGDGGLGHGHANATILYICHTAIAKAKLAEEAKPRKR